MSKPNPKKQAAKKRHHKVDRYEVQRAKMERSYSQIPGITDKTKRQVFNEEAGKN